VREFTDQKPRTKTRVHTLIVRSCAVEMHLDNYKSQFVRELTSNMSASNAPGMFVFFCHFGTLVVSNASCFVGEAEACQIHVCVSTQHHAKANNMILRAC